MATSENTQDNLRQRLALRIRERREQLRMTQQQLAQAASLGAAQSVSDIEREKRDVRAYELGPIAKALHWNLTDLFGDMEEEEEEPVVVWRSKPDDMAMAAQDEARFRQLWENYHLAEIWADEELAEELPEVSHRGGKFDIHWARTIAEEARQALGLGSLPASALLQTLEERYGVKIFFLDGLSGSAASSRGPFGVAIALNAKERPWRRNYSLAHELFHLMTWKLLGPETSDTTGTWSTHIEKLAEAFASSLLLPEDAVRKSLDRRREEQGISQSSLIDMAREFAVSSEALLWRLVSLEILKEKQVRELLAGSGFRAMDRMSFPLSAKPDLYPERFFRLLEVAYRDGEVSMGRVAEMTGYNLAETHRWLSQLDTEEETNARQGEQFVRLA